MAISVPPGPPPPPPPAPPAPPVTPFWAWNRLETRPRQQDFNKVLRAEIHDPLWMLGRQWQMGEFTGMDSGSGILARVQVNYQQINGTDSYNNFNPVAYNMEIPLEPMVEAVSYNWSIKERVLMGKKWLYFVRKALGAGPAYTAFLLWFNNNLTFPYGFILDVSEPNTSWTDQKIIAGADIYSNVNANNFINATSFSDIIIDGSAVYEKLTIGPLTDVLSTFSGYATLTTPIANFMAWVRKMYSLPVNNQEKWLPSSMEYQFDTYWLDSATTAQNRLFAKKFHGGHFDWDAFVQDSTTYTPTPSPPLPVIHNTFSQQMVMSGCQFPGMPGSRWWEFEDGNLNFCNLDADPTDLAKIILTQFALIFQNDWFLIPCTLPVGSYCEVQGIVVSDVFGVNTFVGNYSSLPSISGSTITGFTESPTDWKSFRWLDVSTYANVVNTSVPTGSMIITPVTNGILESKPIESVLFLRDEMADLVWGIENTVPDKLGKGQDGQNAANNFIAYMKKLRNSSDNTLPNPIDPTAKLSYQLEANPVPEHWIPFTPVHVSPPATNNRQIQYQRATMPRILDQYATSLIRPRTEILNYGLRSVSAASPPSPPVTGTILFPQSYGLQPEVYQPLYINEEEVPQAGTVVQTKFKRARWFNGRTINWVGRTRKTGRGEGNSGLSFDSIKTLST